ncbi:MAG: TetR/AcrR family transcriptional regulator [Mesorhizobium sp.]|nr:TetR/AcrR family transcriptional regulator [Mesorhizobium sp.]
MTEENRRPGKGSPASAPTIKAPRPRGRPRSRRSRDAILDAAAHLLRQGGLPALTVDAVVAHARVSKGTVYRIWESKSAVAIDAILGVLNREIVTPDTGSSREDFRALMLQFADVLQRGGLGYTYMSLLIEAQQDNSIASAHRRLFRERRKVFFDVVASGIDRGELPANLDRDLLSDMLFGPIVLRLMTGVGQIDDAMIEATLETVYRGASALREAQHSDRQ